MKGSGHSPIGTLSVKT